MQTPYLLYTSFLIASLLLTCLLLVIILKYRHSSVARAYLWMLIISGLTALAMLFSMYSPSTLWAIWWHGNFRLAVYAFLVPMGFWFIYAFAQQMGGKSENRWLRWVFLAPAITALFSLTNFWHQAMFGEYVMVEVNGIYLRQTWQPGWWFWFHAWMAYGFSAGILYLLWSWVRRTRQLPRYRGAIMLGCALIIIGSISLDTFGFYPAPGLLWLPVSMGAMNVIIMAGMWYLELFDVLPVARETLLRRLSDIVIVLDAQNQIVDLNQAGESAFGVKLADVKGTNFAWYLPPDWQKPTQEIFEQPSYRGLTTLEVHGESRQFDVSVNSIYLEENFIGASMIVLRDITEHKRAEKALRESEERHRFLYETIAQGVIYQSPDARPISANPAAEKILGLSQEEMIEREAFDTLVNIIREDGSIFPADERPAIRALETGKPIFNVVIGFQNMRKGIIQWLNVSSIPQFRPGESRPYQVYTTLTDITELRKLQQDERRLAALVERQRLARDLHDAVSQNLFSARLIAETVLKQTGEQLAPLQRANLVQVVRLVKSALGEMRILLLELRPDGLANAELPVLLSHLVDATSGRSDANIQLTLEGISAKLPVAVKIALYRIAQEALNNAIKHANATQITLTLRREDGDAQLSIHDDGRGFDIRQSNADRFGLNIMQERAYEIGAEIAIESQPEQGTRISCCWRSSVK